MNRLIFFVFLISAIIINTNAARRRRLQKLNGNHDLRKIRHRSPSTKPRSSCVCKPIVKTSTGRVKGLPNQKTRLGESYDAFLGIPYGTFDKRFEDSRAVDPWKGIFNANKYGPSCAQLYNGIIGEEQGCLRLNVFRRPPLLESLKFKGDPVMVFIHGGGFVAGNSSIYGPDYLLDEQAVVLVTLNYRLGPFGWLNMGIKEAGGNQGAKDVLLALKWVQDNIAAFTGNPDIVTVFGEDSGGAIATALVHSPLVSKGLFHHVIAASGSSLSPASFNPKPKYYGRLLAEKVGCLSQGDENKSAKRIISCLQTKSVEALLKYNEKGLRTPTPTPDVKWFNNAEYHYGLTIDGSIEGVDGFMPLSPTKLLSTGQYSSIPIMIGANFYDSFLVLPPSFDEKWKDVMPALLDYKDNPNRDAISRRLKKLYWEGDGLADCIRYENVINDRFWYQPARKYARLIASTGGSAYLYNFTKVMRDVGEFGSSPWHGEELNYLFNIAGSGWPAIKPPISPTSLDFEFSQLMVRLWQGFGASGEAGEILPGSVTFEKMNPNDQKVKWYDIDNEERFIYFEESNFFRERMEFWDKFTEEK